MLVGRCGIGRYVGRTFTFITLFGLNSCSDVAKAILQTHSTHACLIWFDCLLYRRAKSFFTDSSEGGLQWAS